MAKRQSPSGSKTFTAILERFGEGGLNWVIVRLPVSVEKAWGTRRSLSVRVQVNGFEYQTALLPEGGGTHFLIVNKKAQKAARIAPGTTATFVVTPKLKPEVLQLPAELERALKQDRAVRKWFDLLSRSARKWLIDIVAGGKSAETRRRRAERVAEQVMEAMEAEIELPPMLQRAFSRIPGAERAWQSMTERQRRHNLLAIFYYRTPDSRLRRIARVFEKPSNDQD